MTTATAETPRKTRGRKSSTALTTTETETKLTAPPEPSPPEPEPEEPPFLPPDDDDDGDDGDGEQQPMFVAARPLPPQVRPSGPAGAPDAHANLAAANAQVRAHNVNTYLQVEDDFKEMTEGLNFGMNEHVIKLTRTRSNPPGATKGFLGDFYRKLPVSEIQELYGGGEFLYTIWGPDAAGKVAMKRKRTIVIEGVSLVNGKPVDGGLVVDQGIGVAKDFIKAAMDASTAREARLHEELKELKKDQIQLLSRDPTAGIMAMLKENHEKEIAARLEMAKLEDARKREERDLAEQRRKDEKAAEDQRRADERQAREDEKTRGLSEAKSIMEMQQANTNLLIATMKEKESSQQSAFNMMLTTLQSANTQQLQTLQANFQQQMTMSAQQMQATIQTYQSGAEMREKMLLDVIKDARQNKGGLQESLGQLVTLKTQLDALSGGNNQQGGGVMDTLREAASSPAFSGLVQSLLARPAAPQLAAQQNQPVAMGVVNVSGGQAPRQQQGPSPWPTPTGSPHYVPPKPKPKQAPKAPAMAVPPITPSAQPAPPTGPTPESIGIIYPPDNATPEQKFTALGTALDAAVRADWEPEHMMEAIVKKFPADIIVMLKETPFAQCVQTIELMQPTSVLNTAAGQQVMRKLYDMMGLP